MRIKKSKERISLQPGEITEIVDMLKASSSDTDIAQFLVATTRDGIKDRRKLEAEDKNILHDETFSIEQLVLSAFNELEEADKLRVINNFIVTHKEGLGPTVTEVINTFEEEQKRNTLKFETHAKTVGFNAVVFVIVGLVLIFWASVLFNHNSLNSVSHDVGILSKVMEIINVMFFTN